MNGQKKCEVKIERDFNGNTRYSFGEHRPITNTLGDILGEKLKAILEKETKPKEEKIDRFTFYYRKFMEANKDKPVVVISYRQWFSFVEKLYRGVIEEKRPPVFFVTGVGVCIGCEDLYKLSEDYLIKVHGETFVERVKQNLEPDYESYLSLRLEKDNSIKFKESPFFENKGIKSFVSVIVLSNPKVDFLIYDNF